jgi:hypothetical protein
MSDYQPKYGSPESVPDQLDSEIRDRLKGYLERKRDKQKDNTPNSYKVTIELCEIMNDMYDNGIGPTEICKVMPFSSPSTVRYHVDNKCKHERRSRVTYSECGWMRIKARKGKSTKEISNEYNTDSRIIRKHVTGQCNHESGIDKVSLSELERETRKTVDRVESICPICESAFEHRETEQRTTCSKSCNMKYAAMKSHGKSPDITSD